MASGQSGRPGPHAREAVRAESPIERGSATTPGRDLHNNSAAVCVSKDKTSTEM